ncbi:MAG: peptidylprolyl isomerase [Armatimonadota bacterium]
MSPEDQTPQTRPEPPRQSFWKRHNLWIWALLLLAIIGYSILDAQNTGRVKPAKHDHTPPAQAEQPAEETDELVGDFDGELSGAQEALDNVEIPTTQFATLHTSKGDITIKFFPEDAPKTVANFVKLAKDGFYDGLLFHRVIQPFMIQAGCPRGDGTGGPGYTFEDEINDHKIVAGTVAMANSGPDTNGSQFFIVTEKPQPHLDGKHTVFGEVTEGMDVVREIAAVETGARDKPVEDITINSIDLKE